MALKTTLEQLESVQNAIATIEEGGQAYSISGRSLSYADLETLYRRETFLTAKYNRESTGSGGISVRRFTPQG